MINSSVIRWFKRRFQSKKSEAVSPAQNDYALVAQSGLFDAAWYLAEYKDVAAAGVDPLLHYLRHGASEGRSPGSHFDEAFYLSQCVRRGLKCSDSEGPLLLHYLKAGKALGLKPAREWDESPWWWPWHTPTEDVIATKDLLNRLSSAPPVTVIVPVFNAAEQLAECLASLAAYTHANHRILLIDDASTDPRVAELFARYGQLPGFECHQNAENLGFTRTVNRGMAMAAGCDVVLLNSDTRVTPGWLRRLRYAAWQSSDIATVTPISDNAGAFSAPCPGFNSLPADIPEYRIGRAVAQVALKAHPLVPTGNGFCLYIRRDCLDQVGLFDEQAFPRGYGEENDFCMRASRHGWRHVIDDSTYILHSRSASFGEQKKALLDAGRKVIEQRYPQYGELVREAFSGTALKQVRERVGELMKMPVDQWKRVRPRILYVIASRSGGTPQTNQDLMGALSDRVECFVLQCNRQRISLQHFEAGVYTEVASHTLKNTLQAFPHRDDEYDQVVAAWLKAWNVELIHVRHIAWHSLGLLEVARVLEIPCVFSFHDYYTLCPSVKLLDNHQQFCAGVCTEGQGRCSVELWPQDSFAHLKHGQVHDWREIFGKSLSNCDAFVTTSAQVRNLVLQTYPHLAEKPFSVIPHGRDFDRMQQLAVCPTKDERLRLVIPGNISQAKGGEIIASLAQVADRHNLEIHILGKVAPDIKMPGSVVCHGEYTRELFQHLLTKIRPHIGAVLSIWPETWCHTLTELWSAGVPVIGFDSGAVGERLAHTGAGWRIATMTPEAVLQCLEEVRTPKIWRNAFQAVVSWQKNEGQSQSCLAMGDAYWRIYRQVLMPLNLANIDM